MNIDSVKTMESAGEPASGILSKSLNNIPIILSGELASGVLGKGT